MTTAFFPEANNQLDASKKDFIPVAVFIGIDYADGNNFKEYNSFLYSNKANATMLDIQNAFQRIGHEGVLCRQWGLVNQAPIDHPSIKSHNDYDHCYNSIDGFIIQSQKELDRIKREHFINEFHEDISTILNAVKNEGTKDWFDYCKLLDKDELQKAIEFVSSHGYTVSKTMID